MDGDRDTDQHDLKSSADCKENTPLAKQKEVEKGSPTGSEPLMLNKKLQRQSKIDVRRQHLSVSSYVDEDDENKERGNWTGKLDFILSCLSYAVGLGNVWRFPYQCYRNGGGAFLIPFMIMLVIAGIPLFFLESAFGQYASSGVISIWKAAPIFEGIGWGMFLVSFFVSIYYNVIISWTFFYLFASLRAHLPWETCGNDWNTPACRVRELGDARNCSSYNGTWYNSTCHASDSNFTLEYLASQNTSSNNMTFNMTTPAGKSPSDEYFHRYVLEITEGIHDLGQVRWQIALCLLLAWTVVCICMIRGIKSSGKAVYFTATFPYLVLLILMVRGLTLPGSLKGVIYYLTPKWDKLITAQVWGDAAVQIFFSLAPGWGGLITLSSYNKFHNNCLRDTYIVCIGDCITSVFAGFVIFAIIGFMAEELALPIEKVASEGAGLAFIVYPEVVTRLPISPLWAILFFLMLITLGIGTQFAIVTTVHTTIMDKFPKLFRKGYRPSVLMIALCSICFLFGLSICTQGGMYMLQLFDNYAATYSVLTIALTESIALAWVYGYKRLQKDIDQMIGVTIGLYWRITWQFITPIFLVAIMVFTCIKFKPSEYNKTVFPWWADLLGWGISLSAILAIPAVALYKIIFYKDKSHTILQRLKKLSAPTEDWGPALPQHAYNEAEYNDPLNAAGRKEETHI